MVDYHLINELDHEGTGIEAEMAQIFAGMPGPDIEGTLAEPEDDLKPGTILTGRVVGRAGDDVVVDVGLKSEGLVPAAEWDDISSVDVGDKVSVWLETVESDSGHIVLSKRKADRILNWQNLVATKHEGDKVRGRVMRKIKGGLLVDIGYPVFLPASQVDIRRPGDIGEYIGKEVEAKILKIDTDRRNIVISRRKLIEEERAAAKEALMAEIAVGQIRRGIVKNIADFGAFVDLGGIDGLLHITDMSWDRIGHPSELLKIDQEVEVKVLSIDVEREKIALGLKQLTENPWEHIEQRYPVGARLRGEVVNIMNYGAFVKIEPGVEGLIHISEMSWTKRINHPSELLNAGDAVDVIVLDINKNKQEISLGLKQTQENPWTHVAEKYPPNTRVNGRVRNLTNYGAFVEIEEGIDGLLHVSDMSWTKKISHPSEVVKKGDVIDCVVLKVEEDKQRIALGLKQLHEDPWLRAVPENYIPGQIVEGTVTKITNFGVFVELEQDLEGLLHISELADHKVEDPHQEVKIGDKILVKILRVDPQERKIGLSKKRAEWSIEQEGETGLERKPKARRGGLESAIEDSTVDYEPLPPVPPVAGTAVRDGAPKPAKPGPEGTAGDDGVSDAAVPPALAEEPPGEPQ
ncbi:MAG TPA: 30S ribosomal protein S1 [Phycisphaerae bacterium]|nr:30S ribosomal protein S1 [Phycisphaerae bacterium]HNU43913.1 30S ribosomal protein S1 [Phycisphaerae bacterium]